MNNENERYVVTFTNSGVQYWNTPNGERTQDVREAMGSSQLDAWCLADMLPVEWNGQVHIYDGERGGRFHEMVEQAQGMVPEGDHYDEDDYDYKEGR